MGDGLTNFYPDDFNNIIEPFFLGVGLIDREPPTFSTNLLYNIAGVLYWNGLPVGSSGGDLWQLEGGTGPNIYYVDGNVGIGKTTASYPLDVHGVIKTDDDVIISSAKEIQFQDNIGGLTAYISRSSGNDLAIVNETSAKDILLTTNAGKVGVTGDISISGLLKLMEAGGGTDLATISVAALGAARAYTIPDAGATALFLLSTTTGPAKGDILYNDGVSWVSLPAGNSGEFLKTQGAGADPVWATGATGSTGPGTNVRVYSWTIQSPAVGGIPGPRIPQAQTCTGLYSYITGGTSAAYNIEERTAPGVTGTNILTTDQLAIPTGAMDTSFSHAGLAPGSWLWVDVSGVTGTVPYIEISLNVTVD